MEIEQHTPKESSESKKKTGEFIKFFEMNKNENQTKMYEMQLKQCLERNL